MKKYIGILLILCISFFGCKKYLEAKPDKSLAIPSSASDLQAILDNYSIMNQASPEASEESADSYYLTDISYNAISDVSTRNNYIWADQGERNGDWVKPYMAIFYSNVVLDEIKKIKKNDNATDLNNIKGSALFFRSLYFYEIAQIFAPQYSANTLNSLCVPLRLNSDASIASKRATVNETYTTIISDLKSAAALLPPITPFKNRASRASAFGLLARVYLNTSDYKNAALYADSCLSIYNKLIDYNTLDLSAEVPIRRFNDEVIFASQSVGASQLLSPSGSKIDTTLLAMYAGNDLRKNVFFQQNTDGKTYQFKGSYDGSFNGTFFTGIATDELYLIIAESYARLGSIELSTFFLNKLMINRISKATFTDIKNLDQKSLLDVIISERRKELVFRGIRWSDIRRLNNEESYKTIVSRKLASKEIALLTPDKRYIALIPNIIIANSSLIQNER